MGLLIVFWICSIIIFYTYLGYAFLLFFVYQFKKPKTTDSSANNTAEDPLVCLFVTAFNEKDFIDQKVKNSYALNYPGEKIQYLWVTDGSDDGTPELLKKYPNLEIHHLPERKGKIHAMNRGMKFVKAPIVIFSDTNTILGENSIREIVTQFQDKKVGCVAGEKRIVNKNADSAVGAGEGFYWKFESWIKKMDAGVNSAVGGVGELFAIRTELFNEVENDTLLDDFIISLRIAKRGYKIAYAPNAYAEETASLNVKEELKRKIRIAAGGLQTVFRLKELLNPFKYGILTWQYISHKVLRWTVAPICLFLLFFVNGFLFTQKIAEGQFDFYFLSFLAQLFFYLLAAIGWVFENYKIRLKLLFIPFYFLSINYASIIGIFRFLKGKQSVVWEKSKRS